MEKLLTSKSLIDMMRLLMTLTVFIALTKPAFSQSPDSLAADTVIRKKFVPTGLRFGIDVISPIKSEVKDNFSGWEATADIDVHRYLISADVGSWSVTGRRDSSGYLPNDQINLRGYSSTYANSGNYWRAGVSANFLTRDPERNVFFIGLRYGRAKYNESMTIAAEDSIWGPVSQTFSAENKTARWFELASGIKVKIWKFIWMGYSGSVKFGLKTHGGDHIVSYDVPGYGKVGARGFTWGAAYHIMFRIPFRPTTPILPPKKK